MNSTTSSAKEIIFHLGETLHSVATQDVTPETTLNTYFREKLFLTGTKRMCLEGGCGVCVVAVEAQHPKDGKKRVFAVNSCLASIYSCHGWKIHTVEGIGNSTIGYHQVQKTLADNNGTQCGFCSPGMVMNMYALHESGLVTKTQVENSFGSNICRCTGYRPILDAFKKLATDTDNITEIEDLHLCRSSSCENTCEKKCYKQPLVYATVTNSKWMKVYTVNDLLQILRTVGNAPYQLVGGNTARGVYKPTVQPQIYVDITSVSELTTYDIDGNTLVLGGNYTLTGTVEVFRELSRTNANFSYLDKMADHIDLVAHVPVRNIGTIAGNLMIKHQYNEFPSDIFLILEAVNATVVIVDDEDNETRCSPADFLKVDMRRKVIKEIILIGYNSSYRYGSYKIMIRAQNTHALVNAAFLLRIGDSTIQSARICFGAINPTFVHAINTENLLKNKNIFDNNVLQSAIKSLENEIQPDYVLPDPTPQFRKQLAIGLFYKFVLNIAPADKVSPRRKTGGLLLVRPLSSGMQDFGTNKATWPVGQPVIKLEALNQTTGQAEYIADQPNRPFQLHAAFVTANAPAGSQVTLVDASTALKRKGVVAFFSKKDIPGSNTFMPKMAAMPVQEELFCSGRVQYYFQPIGVIVAESHDLAVEAAEMVNVTYSPPKTKPLLTIRDVLNSKIKERIKHQTSVIAKMQGNDVARIVKGQLYIGQQYHFHMEVQTCNVVPTEDGIDIYAATQWMDLTQCAAAEALGIPTQKINVYVRRLGGAFGAKISRNSLVSTAAALAAYKLRKPVKMWLPFEQNMNIIGKRFPLLVDYEVAVNKTGVIQYLNASNYSDFGVGGNEPIDSLLIDLFQNGYDIKTWTFDTYTVTTDTYGNCWTRAPGTVEGLAAIETIMEHIASELGIEDPFEVKMANVDKTKWPKLVQFIGDLKNSAEVTRRRQEIKEFNNANRWKKKGMSLVPMVWTLEVTANFTIYVSIFHGDGGVQISHGGIEMGQGINTKVAQACAYKFGIPLEKIQVRPSFSLVAPNSSTSGGSLTSEAVVYALLKACDTLLERIKPVRDKMNNPKWEELIKRCFQEEIQLCATGYYADVDKNPGLQEYQIFGVCATEVEVDILTGQHQILRVDILEDLGDSMSPLIDMGQVEGAFVMGIGYYTTEELVFNQEGRLLTNRTWTYKPPGAKDIPIDFRVSFPKNNPNPIGVLKSKAVAEPPICLSIALPLAIRNAVASARAEADSTKSKWYPIDGPSTVENTLLNTLNDYNQYVL